MDTRTHPAHAEQALEPDLAIVDPHHHLWPDGAIRVPPASNDPDDEGALVAVATPYDLDDLHRDVSGGHRIVATLYVECLSKYREQGPHELRPVGETEWVAEQFVDDGLLSGIIGYAELTLGSDVGRVLDAHIEAGRGRFKGVRYSASWDPHPDAYVTPRRPTAHVLLDREFSRGVTELARRDLVFESWLYFHQLPEIRRLALDHPDVTIVVNHLGGPAASGPYTGRRDDVLTQWRANIAELRGCPNVVLKLGAIGMRAFIEPHMLETGPHPSEFIARYWGDEIRYCIDTLTPQRCMFESNYPVDSHLCDYVTLWNTFKIISAGYSATDREHLFSATAKRVYGV